MFLLRIVMCYYIFISCTLLQAEVAPSISISQQHQDKLFQMYDGFLVSRAMHVFAELRIADHLAIKPRAIDKEFAQELQVNQEMLYRLLRMLAGHCIVDEDEQGVFSLTELGSYIRSDHPQTMARLRSTPCGVSTGTTLMQPG